MARNALFFTLPATTVVSLFVLVMLCDPPEVLDTAGITDEEDNEDSSKAKKKGKKKGKHVVVTYDPDRDMTVVKKKHKRGANDWGWEE